MKIKSSNYVVLSSFLFVNAQTLQSNNTTEEDVNVKNAVVYYAFEREVKIQFNLIAIRLNCKKSKNKSQNVE